MAATNAFIYDIGPVRQKLKPLVEEYLKQSDIKYVSTIDDLIHFWIMDSLEESRLASSSVVNTTRIDLNLLMFFKGLPAALKDELTTYLFQNFRMLWHPDNMVNSRLISNALIVEV